ncbi:integrator complex subunit 15-like [Antedon mediterranea]|uniref:integrator complex subunit 15-like n=1 Tax=Antedon mediterranea TaxID=105859 RepID=UPI003AF8B1FE
MASYMDQGGNSPVFLWYSDLPTRLPEICRALHQKEFPLATRSLLDWMAEYFIQCQNFPPGKFPNRDIVSQLLDLFVFYQPLDGFVPKKLTSLDSLQIIELLCQFFSTGKSAPIMYSVFDALFGCSRDVICEAHRFRMLCQLVSMAISVKCVSVLNNTAIWLCNQDCSTNSLTLVSSLVKDFCVLVPESLSSLEDTTLVCRQFSCQFMTSAIKLFYETQGPRSTVAALPANLLELFTKWLNQDYSICIVSIQSPLPRVPSFRDRGGYMTKPTFMHLSALPGLVNCCVVGPLQRLKSKGSESEDETQIYSRLLFGILQTLLQAQLLKKGQPQHRVPKELLDVLMSLLTAENLRRIVESFNRVIIEGSIMPQAEEVQTSLDRFSQVVQVALATGTTHCSRGNMVDICKGLPNNKLLHLILSHSNKMDVSQKATASPQKQSLPVDMQH